MSFSCRHSFLQKWRAMCTRNRIEPDLAAGPYVVPPNAKTKTILTRCRGRRSSCRDALLVLPQRCRGDPPGQDAVTGPDPNLDRPPIACSACRDVMRRATPPPATATIGRAGVPQAKPELMLTCPRVTDAGHGWLASTRGLLAPSPRGPPSAPPPQSTPACTVRCHRATLTRGPDSEFTLQRNVPDVSLV
jgi:hypothetical protein